MPPGRPATTGRASAELIVLHARRTCYLALRGRLREPIWRLFGRRTRPLMYENGALDPSASAIEHDDAAALPITR
jgi:hypothetical protein